MNKKLALVFFQVFLLITCFFALSPKPTHAAFSCRVSPTNFTTVSNPISFAIEGFGNFSDSDYFISYGDTCVGSGHTLKIGGCADNSTVFNPVDGRISVSLNTTLEAKSYVVGVYLKSAPTINQCQNAGFKVNPATSGGSCTVNFAIPDSDFTPTNDIRFYLSGFTNETIGKNYHYILRLGNSDGSSLKEGVNSGYNFSSSTSPINLGVYPSGSYYLDIRDSNFAGLFENRICFATFQISVGGGGPSDSGPGAPIGSPSPPPPPPCSTRDTDGNCDKVATGLGKIGTDTSSFVKSLFGVLLGIIGGLAVLLIIISGYRIMVSQGNPEKVQQAREQLTAAITGLLFVIFSLVILQVIGYDILRLPGFSP